MPDEPTRKPNRHIFSSQPPAPAGNEGDRGLVVVVGPCASGKSTLAERLRGRGYTVRPAAQEHSYVPGLWQMSEPDFLLYLHAELATVRARRHNPHWHEAEWLAQQGRLAQARAHADAVILTDSLTADEVEAAAMRTLDALAGRVQQRRAARPTAAGDPPLRRRFEVRRAIADDLPTLRELLGRHLDWPLGAEAVPLEGDYSLPDRAGCLVAVATDTPRASLYAHYRGEIIAAITYGPDGHLWARNDEPEVVEVNEPRLREVGFNRRAVLTRLLRAVPKAVVAEVKRLRHTADATSPAVLAEFKAGGYQLARHTITLSDADLSQFVTIAAGGDSSGLLEYEQRGLQVVSEADVYELPIHQGGFSLSEYLRQQEAG